jgi:hypothetical protein
MELWIRSQDRTFLRKVNTIGIVEGRDFWSIDENLTVSFGKYKTKERAIEILDEIHKCIIDKEVLHVCNNLLTLISKSSLKNAGEIIDRTKKIAVYEMPKE